MDEENKQLKLKEPDSLESVEGESSLPRYRIICTTCTMLCFFVFGLGSSIVGPTLVHMGYILEVNITLISLTLTFGRVGYLTGSLLGGLLYDRFNHELQLFLCTFLIGIMTIVLPFAPDIYVYFLFNTMQSIARGYQDTAIHPYMLSLWAGHRLNNPMMQAMHAVWTIGTALSQFIVAPFLVDIHATDAPNNNSGLTTNNNTGSLTNSNTGLLLNPTLKTDVLINTTTESGIYLSNVTFVQPRTILEQNPDIYEVFYAFGIIGIIITVCSLSFLVPYFLLGATLFNHSKAAKSTRSALTNCDKYPQNTLRIILGFQFIAFAAYSMYQFIPADFLTAFVIEGLDWTAYKGPWLTGVYWGSNAIGRIINTPLSLCLSPSAMLTFNLTFTTLAFILMYIATMHYTTLLWVAVAIAGFSMSSTVASSFLWNSNIMHVTGAVSGLLLVAASSGGMTASALTGYMFESFSHMWVLYLCFIACLCHVFSFTCSEFIVRCSKKVDVSSANNSMEIDVREPLNSKKL